RASTVLQSADSILLTQRRRFFDPNRIVHADTRHSYGEESYQLSGFIEQRLRWFPPLGWKPFPGSSTFSVARSLSLGTGETAENKRGSSNAVSA
ncbi:MAG TPA: hypothetical protein VI457_05610, partial [Methylococcaceae bacterium]|nr:hypothetical protein [Methylococcaceae bacterium]